MSEEKTKWVLWEFFKDQLKSFSNDTIGNSARKSSAFMLGCMVVMIHVKYVDDTNSKEILVIDLTYMCVLLGMVGIEKILDAIISIFKR